MSHKPIEFIGQSPVVQQLKQQVDRWALTDHPILIRGEGGTGKELVAQFIHEHSPRLGSPFVLVNCAALAPKLLEIEIFGLETAILGAAGNPIFQPTCGQLIAADTGTIVLKGIEDIPLDLQGKICTFLHTGEFSAFRSQRTKHANVRIIGTTHFSLDELVAQGDFSPELYRAFAASIIIPPLRERREDIPLLARHLLLEDSISISQEVINLFLKYPWPGNVRELSSVLEYAQERCESDTILPVHLPTCIRQLSPA